MNSEPYLTYGRIKLPTRPNTSESVDVHYDGKWVPLVDLVRALGVNRTALDRFLAENQSRINPRWLEALKLNEHAPTKHSTNRTEASRQSRHARRNTRHDDHGTADQRPATSP